MSAGAIAEALPATKLAPPRMPQAMIARTRLLDRLDRGAEGPMTLLAAPAGAGTSALVSSWIAAGRPQGPVAWLSLDGDDADRRRFWRLVLASLTRATGDQALAELDVSPREPMTLHVVCALVEALAEREVPVTLVLDDFHAVAGVLREDIARLVRFAPPSLRLVVVTRSDPVLGLGRLRLDDSLTEIRFADLAFTLDETAALFEELEIELLPADLRRLWERSEGWAAALRLAASSLRHGAEPRAFVDRFAGTDLAMSDYLLTEVLARQPPDVYAFLLRTSIVECISPGLANALTGGTDGRAMIARLEQGGMLTMPVDEHGLWHRYHPLFAELLQAELRAQRPDVVDVLHRCAATWLARHGRDAAALRHAVAGSAWDLTAELVTERWIHLLVEGGLSALRPIVEAVPRARVEGSPELALAFGGALLAGGDQAGAASYLRFAEAHTADVPAERRSQFVAGLVAVGLYEGRLRGDPAKAVRAARELLERDAVLDSEEIAPSVRAFLVCQLGILEVWTGELEAAIGHLEAGLNAALGAEKDWIALAARAYLAVARAIRGEVPRAVHHAEDALDLAQRRGWARTEPAGASYLVLAALAVEQKRHEECRVLLDRAAEALRDARDRPLPVVHALIHSLLLADQGRFADALSVLQVGREELGNWPLLPQLDQQLVGQEGVLRVALGDREGGERMLESANGAGRMSMPVGNALAKLRLLDGDPAAAHQVLAPQLASSAELRDMPPSVRTEAWFLDALALDALGRDEDAARSLERALELAEPAGLSRVLTAQGSSGRALLRRHAQNSTAHSGMVGQALEALEHRGNGATRPSLALAVELSERERAILRYLPTLMSNAQIASELRLSVNTVKTHLKAIYRKLDVPDRRRAVERGRELGLMP